jgi:hypothetical protein
MFPPRKPAAVRPNEFIALKTLSAKGARLLSRFNFQQFKRI